MIEDRIKNLRDELNQRNEEIDILKGEASKQINQIGESITKFLDKETGTQNKTLFKEQHILYIISMIVYIYYILLYIISMIVYILTAVCMDIGVRRSYGFYY